MNEAHTSTPEAAATGDEAAPDVVVIGAGISGSEAAWHCAKSGVATLLLTTSLDTSYNLARDVERLNPPPGTLLAELLPPLTAADGAVANFALHRAVKRALESEPLLHTLQATASGLLSRGDAVSGVRTWEGVERYGKLVALCVGSFLEARLHVGSLVEQQGRLSEMAYDELYLDLRARGFTFEQREFRLDAVSGGLPYVVKTPVLALQERADKGFALPRYRGLYAAGACVADRSSEPPSYEEAAEQGRALGAELVAALRR